jgi:predicted CXXCH cytochrome family protein
MRRAVFAAAVIVLAAAGNAAAQSQIASGPHDFSTGSGLRNTDAGIAGQTCVFCHTPHGGSLAAPLWNRSSSTSTYQVYASSTMDASAPTSVQIQSGVSGACMSCHDGSIAIDVLLNLNGVARRTGSIAFTKQTTSKAVFGASGTGQNNILTGGTPYLGTDLRDDHPVTIVYEQARVATPAEFVQQVITGSKITVGATEPLPLFGASSTTATVECASCHNPHDNSRGFFLRKSNVQSALCLTCHIK